MKPICLFAASLILFFSASARAQESASQEDVAGRTLKWIPRDQVTHAENEAARERSQYLQMHMQDIEAEARTRQSLQNMDQDIRTRDSMQEQRMRLREYDY